MLFVRVAAVLVAVTTLAQVSYTDTFNAGINYLTIGVAGTIWDGVYFGAGEFNYPNYLRSEVNGGVAQINPGGFPNGNYWLRIDRIRGTALSKREPRF